MTVRSWLIAGLVLLGCFSLLDVASLVVSIASSWTGVIVDAVWVGGVSYFVIVFALMIFPRDIAGWILGPGADKPAPLDTWDLVRVGAALIGMQAILSGCKSLADVAVMYNWAGRDGVIEYYLREVWMGQFVGFLAVISARAMPKIMRLPRDASHAEPSSD